MNRLLAVALIFSCGAPRLAHAVSPVVAAADPELRAEASKHFGTGSVFYDEGRYAEAVGEFERAKSLLPAPELDYNIGKALDRLGRWEAAIASYRTYMQSAPSNVDEVKERIADLERRIRTAAVPAVTSTTPTSTATSALVFNVQSPTPTIQHRRRYLAAEVTGGTAFALGVVGAGLLGSAVHDYNALSGPPASYGSIPSRYYAGGALLGVAGAAVAADVVLWVIAKRRSR